MYFQDLSPYSYNLSRRLVGVLNVGWLDCECDYAKGKTPPELLARLKVWTAIAAVNPMRGFQICKFCYLRNAFRKTDLESTLAFYANARESLKYNGREIWLGSDEVWIPSTSGVVFAAPTLIYHYIDVHSYCPPEVFIQAVLDDSLEGSWNAADEFEKRTMEAFAGE